MPKRTGANSKDTVEPSILRKLNGGVLETATLSEALAVDFSCLMANVFPELENEAITRMKKAQGKGITKRMELAATILSEHLGKKVFNILSQHSSDTVRGWAAFSIALDATLMLERKLDRVRQLADDPHFGVREWAWLALRPAISQDINISVKLFVPWAEDVSENIRRFSIEATRPRGVWSKHIQELKESPRLGEPLLNRVMEDSSRYVQNSCANWLNDASKSDPGWVVSYCEKWRKKKESEAVIYITRRALRNVA